MFFHCFFRFKTSLTLCTKAWETLWTVQSHLFSKESFLSLCSVVSNSYLYFKILTFYQNWNRNAQRHDDTWLGSVQALRQQGWGGGSEPKYWHNDTLNWRCGRVKKWSEFSRKICVINIKLMTFFLIDALTSSSLA